MFRDYIRITEEGPRVWVQDRKLSVDVAEMIQRHRQPGTVGRHGGHELVRDLHRHVEMAQLSRVAFGIGDEADEQDLRRAERRARS